MSRSLLLPQIDARQGRSRPAIEALRVKLAPDSGDVISEAGRQRTIEVFGEPLTPGQVVDRIVREVQARGVPAELDFGRKLDRAELTAATSYGRANTTTDIGTTM